MIVHSDSGLGFLLALLIAFAAAIALSVSVVFALERKFRSAAKLAVISLGAMIAWVIFVTLISFATPQTIVKLGDSYCADIRCLAIDRVQTEARGSETIYKLDVRLFSDANTVKVTFGGVSFLLVDEQGRRFPMTPATNSPEASSYDTYLDPGQTIKTTFTFAAASDAKQLFLIDTPRTVLEGAKPSIGGKKAPAWALYVGMWFYLASLGNDSSPLHKPTMLRVL